MKHVNLAVLVISLSALVGCNGKVLVGVVLPETGEAQAYGSSVRSGAKLAFDDAKAARKAPAGLEVIYRDTASDPTRAADEIAQFYKDGALIVIGGATSSEAKASIPIAERFGRILLSPSASAPGLTKAAGDFYRVYPSDTVEVTDAVEFLARDRKFKKVLVLFEDNTYTQELLPVFTLEARKLGLVVLGRLNVGETGWEKKLALALTPARPEDKPEALYLCGYGEAILAALLEVRNANYGGVICTTSAISTVDLLWRGGTLVEGVYFPMMVVDTTSQQEPIKTFVKRYKEVNNLTPDIYAAAGYDAALTVLRVLAEPTPKSAVEVKNRLSGLSDLRGVTGPISFDSMGNIKTRPQLHWVNDGKVELYKPSGT